MRELICKRYSTAHADLTCSITGRTILKDERFIQEIYFTGSDIEYVFISIDKSNQKILVDKVI